MRNDAFHLQNYVLDLLECRGAVTELPGYALAEVLLPDDLAVELALPPHVRLAFDFEVAAENPGSEFITYGSPVLDRLVRLGKGLGRLTRRYAELGSLTIPSGMAERVEKGMEFVRCRRPSLRAASLIQVEYARFDFHVEFLSDEKQEAVYPVLVDRQAGRQVNHQLSWFRGVFFAPQPGEYLTRLPVAEQSGYEAAYAMAGKELTNVIHPDLTAFRERMDGYLRREEERLRAYYQATLKEMDRRAEKLTDDHRKQSLQAKRSATEADFAARLEDVRQKFRVAVEAELDSVTVLVIPKVRLTVDVQYRDKTIVLPLYYNLAASQLEQPHCPACGRPHSVINFNRDGEPRCPACA